MCNVHVKPVAGDRCCHWQFASISRKPEILKASPESLQPLLVGLVHLRDVEPRAEHFVSRGEHNGLQDFIFNEKSTKVTLAAFSVSTTACVNSWMNSVLRELTGALFMLTVAMPLASVSTETWAKPVGEELKLAEGRAKLRLRLKVNLLQLREDMLSSLEE